MSISQNTLSALTQQNAPCLSFRRALKTWYQEHAIHLAHRQDLILPLCPRKSNHPFAAQLLHQVRDLDDDGRLLELMQRRGAVETPLEGVLTAGDNHLRAGRSLLAEEGPGHHGAGGDSAAKSRDPEGCARNTRGE